MDPSAHLDFFRSIEHAVFPLTITKADELIHVERLCSAGWLVLTSAPESEPIDRVRYQQIIIRAITDTGRTELRSRQTLGPWDWKKSRGM